MEAGGAGDRPAGRGEADFLRDTCCARAQHGMLRLGEVGCSPEGGRTTIPHARSLAGQDLPGPLTPWTFSRASQERGCVALGGKGWVSLGEGDANEIHLLPEVVWRWCCRRPAPSIQFEP